MTEIYHSHNDIESNTEYVRGHIAIDIKHEAELSREYISINILPSIHKAPCIIIVQPIKIQIKTATGKLFVINIHPHETILRLKKQIYIQQDVSLESQRIIFEGKQLDDHKRICDYNITNESVLHIILRLRGGMFHKSSSRSDWISLNYLDKMEKGLSMLDYMKREAPDKLFVIFEDFEEMIKTSRDDCEIDMIYELIRSIYVE